MKISRVAVAVLAAALLFAACGDDDDNGNDTAAGGGGGDVEAYCEASAALDEQDGPPTDEQFDELDELAPEEIDEDVAFVVERFKDVGFDAFQEGEVNEAIERIEAYEVEECGREPEEEPEAQAPDPDATQVQVTAGDHFFELADAVPSGKVAFVLQNDGDAPHEMGLVRLKDGTTVEEAEAAAEAGLDEIQGLIDDEIGGSSTAAPGEQAVLNAELEPGVYGMACFVSDEEGVPHFAHGMYLIFEVG